MDKNTGMGWHFFLQVIFLTQGSNLHLLHWQVDSLPLSHPGNPCVVEYYMEKNQPSSSTKKKKKKNGGNLDIAKWKKLVWKGYTLYNFIYVTNTFVMTGVQDAQGLSR